MGLFDIGFVIVGSICLILALKNYLKTKKFLKTSIRTLGKVVGVTQEKDAEGGVTYRPMIEFESSLGATQFMGSVSTSTASKYKKGDPVKILCNPRDPKDARINKFLEIWGASVLLGFVGVIFTLVGLFFVFFAQL